MMRADRALSLYLFRPLNALFPSQGAKVPILMYHRVPDADDCASHPYYCTSTAIGVFEQQMRFLRANGYRSVSVREAFQAVQNPALHHNQKLVAITFDDGYRDFYTNAFPILDRYGFSATVYLPTAFIGSSPRRFKEWECLTWSEVRELRAAGIEFGSHTVTHPQLCNLTPQKLRHEFANSKGEIEQNLGESVDSFSYPYAFPETEWAFVRRLRAALEESGYDTGVSTIVGRLGQSDKPLSMRRLPINAHDDQAFFESKLEGSYDWLHAIQYASKLATSARKILRTPDGRR